MKLIWKGKLTQDNAFEYPNLPKNAKPLFHPGAAWSMYLLIIPVLAIAYAAIQLRLPRVEGVMFARPGLLIGVALALLFLVVHEFIHALCCPKGTTIYAYYTSAGISLIPTCKLHKAQYIFMALMPNIILGVLPLAVWIIFSEIGASLGSIMFSFSISCLGMGIGDLYNAILAIVKMPGNSHLVTSGLNCYIVY